MIRSAHRADLAAIRALLAELGYATGEPSPEKLERMLADPDEVVLVYELAGAVAAFVSVHFIPQIALAGDFARISYFCVDDGARGRGIGAELEAHVAALAEQRGCDRIELHCHFRRADAHRFYRRRGYEEVPAYFVRAVSRRGDPT